MRTNILMLGIIALTLTAFNDRMPKNDSAADRMAEKLVVSLRKNSTFEYAELYPGHQAFLNLMDEHPQIYGAYLNEAKKEFIERYDKQVISSFQKSFSEVIEKGKSLGIDWSTIELDHAEVSSIQGEFATSNFLIYLKDKSNQYKLTIEKAIFINKQWKTSPFLSLEKI